MSKDHGKRFIVIESQGSAIFGEGLTQIIVDKETGVNYIWRCQGSAVGLTLLLNEKGEPMTTSFYKK